MNRKLFTTSLTLAVVLGLLLSGSPTLLTADEPFHSAASGSESQIYLPLMTRETVHSTLPQLTQDVYTLTEFAALKQLFALQVMETFTDGYTAGFMQEELTYEQIDALLATQADLAAYESRVNAALMRLEATLVTNQTVASYSSYDQGDVGTASLGGALSRFWNWMSGSAKRSRERTLRVASNYTPAQRERLYNALRPRFQAYGSDSEDFWLKLQDGDLDNAAPQIFNDLYHSDPDFGDDSLDRDLSIQKIVRREGAEGVEAGAELMVEVVKTVTPLGEGMELAEKGIEYINNIGDCLEDPVEFIQDEIKNKVVGELEGFVDIDGLVDAEPLGQGLGQAVKTLTDIQVGSENPADWFKEAAEWGVAQVLDLTEQEVTSDVAIAVSIDPEQALQVVISLLDAINATGDKEIHVGLPAGDWSIAAVTEEGNHDTVEVEIKEQENSVVVVNTDPEADQPGTEFSLSVWIAPASPGPGQSVTVYARIAPAVAGEEIFFSIVGTDGYTKSETNLTNAEGLATFYIPGGGEGVVDTVTVRLVRTGQTRVITYSFR